MSGKAHQLPSRVYRHRHYLRRDAGDVIWGEGYNRAATARQDSSASWERARHSSAPQGAVVHSVAQVCAARLLQQSHKLVAPDGLQAGLVRGVRQGQEDGAGAAAYITMHQGGELREAEVVQQ